MTIRMIQRRDTKSPFAVVFERFRGTTENRDDRILEVISHWDQAENRRAELGHLAGRWTSLARAAGARRLGVNRIEVDPGM